MKHHSLFSRVPQAFSYPGNRNPTPRSVYMLGPLSPDRQAQQLDCWHWLVVTLVVALFFPLAMSGCYWLKYGKLMRTHVDLLVSMAKKMGDLLEDDRRISLEEFSYPLERARDFVRIVSSRYAERRSLQTFNRFLDMYAELLKEGDRLRGKNEDTTRFRGRIEALREEGEKVKAILTEEGL